MAALMKLQQQVPSIVAELFKRIRIGEEARPQEQAAAVTIQRFARGFLTRRRLDRFKDVIVTIQRCWRGYLGRQRYKLAREAHDKHLRQAYFDSKAITIQRHWRGFWSRKHLFDFAARKRYLAAIRLQNARTRAELEAEAERAAAQQRQLAEEAARRMFEDRVGRLHHLVSTTTQPGVFNSPFAAATGTTPTVAGLPVEEHLKAGFKAQAKAFLPPIHGSGSPRTGSAGKPGPPAAAAAAGAGAGSPGSTQRRSVPRSSVFKSPDGPYPTEVLMGGTGQRVAPHITLRQAVPYDFVHQHELLEKKINTAEMLQLHPTAFAHNTRKPHQPAVNPQTNRNMEGYQDPWDPTIGARTDTFTPLQRSISPQRFGRYQHKQPFFDKRLNTDSYTLPATLPGLCTTSPAAAAAIMAAGGRGAAGGGTGAYGGGGSE